MSEEIDLSEWVATKDTRPPVAYEPCPIVRFQPFIEDESGVRRMTSEEIQACHENTWLVADADDVIFAWKKVTKQTLKKMNSQERENLIAGAKEMERKLALEKKALRGELENYTGLFL